MILDKGASGRQWPMRDERETLRRLIADEIASEIRQYRVALDPLDVGYRVAREVLSRLDRMSIQVVSSI